MLNTMSGAVRTADIGDIESSFLPEGEGALTVDEVIRRDQTDNAPVIAFRLHVGCDGSRGLQRDGEPYREFLPIPAGNLGACEAAFWLILAMEDAYPGCVVAYTPEGLRDSNWPESIISDCVTVSVRADTAEFDDQLSVLLDELGL